MVETIPITERDNERTLDIDKVSTFEAAALINAEDQNVAPAIEKVLPQIALAIDGIVAKLQNGGRLFYVGTGTSGRIGVLDASEIPPTYGVSYELVQGVIAGGYDALYKASEASEDDVEAGKNDLISRGLTANDAVVGIAASGRTPYTIGAVKFARRIGCFTACIVCNPSSEITHAVDVAIVPVVGPEAITGSTRMKAGTAQKMVLNIISTIAMVRLGYVSGNRMTNLKSSNEKLKVRSLRILIEEAGLVESEAAELMDRAGGDLRVALVIARTGVDREAALDLLDRSGFAIDKAVTLSRELK